MAAGRLLIPGWGRALDSDGDPISARISLFTTGTDDLAPIYAEQTLTIPLANPVESNSAGRFPAIWADNAVTYDWSVEAPYGPPGSPFTGTGLTSALGADILTAEAAEAAADSAEAAAASAAADLAEIQAIEAAGSTAPAIAGKLDRDGSNVVSAITLRDNIGAQAYTVLNAMDYVAGDGVTNDTVAYQALINLAPSEIVYPEGCNIKVTSTILWIGETNHRFIGDARITGDVNGYVVRGLGYPDLKTSVVASPIARDALSFTVNTLDGLAIGDDFYLIDIVTDEYDVNVIRNITGAGPFTIFTKRPINYAFATAANIRVYGMANACRNVRVFGGTIINENAALGANGLNFLNATDILVDGLTVQDTGGIGISFEVSMRWKAQNVTTINTGSAGLGCRQVKDFEISSFTGRYPNIDESLVFYKNCTYGVITDPTIEQYLFGQAPAGNAGTAGNNILLDERCCNITIANAVLRGSATYSVFVNNGSNRNRIINPDIALADLGGIRFAVSSNDNEVSGGWVTDIIQATDSQQGGIATAAIQDDATCSGNRLTNGTRFARLAGIETRQLSLPAATPFKVRGAMARKIADQVAANFTAAPSVSWDQEVYDTNAIHDNVTNNVRFTVPAGVSFIRAGCNLSLGLVASGSIFSLTLKKNGSTSFDGAVGSGETTTGNPDPDIAVVSGPIPVIAGDYFEWQFYCDDSSTTIVAARSNAWLELLD